MDRLHLLLAALIPALAAMFYAVTKTRSAWRNEALWNAVCIGAVAAVAVSFCELMMEATIGPELTARGVVGAAKIRAFLFAATPEETAKLLVLVFIAERHVEVRRRQDILLVGIAVALGFAAVENLSYVARHGQWGGIAAMRALAAVPGHATAGMAMGALVTMARLKQRFARPLLMAALLVPIGMHGLYDMPLMTARDGHLGAGATLIWLLAMAMNGLLAVAYANDALAEARESDRLAALDRRPAAADNAIVLAGLAIVVSSVPVGFVAIADLDIAPDGLWMAPLFGIQVLILGVDLMLTGRGRLHAPASADLSATPAGRPARIAPSLAALACAAALNVYVVHGTGGVGHLLASLAQLWPAQPGSPADAPPADLPREARDYDALKAAAEGGDAVSQYRLATIHHFGKGGRTADMDLALRYYRLAAAQGYAKAEYNLGCIYDTGEGGLRRDGGEALRLFRAAAGHGDPKAQAYLSWLLWSGREDLPKDVAEAVRWARAAADQGEAQGEYLLGFATMTGAGGIREDSGEGLRLVRQASDKGEVHAQLLLATAYWSGAHGIARDDAEAVRLSRLAANAGNPLGQYFLGFAYLHGRGGLPMNAAEGIRLYRLSARAGLAQAQRALGTIYEKGWGGVEADLAEAARLYRLAADQGDAEAEFRLGLLYEQGGGVEPNQETARSLFQSAAGHGSRDASERLAKGP